MAAPVKMLQTITVDENHDDDDDVDSDGDISSTNDELETTSWGKIYKSLQQTNQSQEILNPQQVFHIASGAVLHGDFVSAVYLYSLGLNCACKKYQHKSNSRDSEGRVKQAAVDKRMLIYALEGCVQDHGKLTSKEFRLKIGKVVDEIVECCDVLSMMDAVLLQAAASVYFNLKDKQKAFHLTTRALHLSPKSLSLQEMLENICCHLVERWHFVMLNDKGRNRAYQKAIKAVLTRMDRKAVVCDVGCGTGLLSLIACQHVDSGQIFAIEKSKSMCEVAHSVFSANLEPAQSGKITLINKMSSQISVPQDMPHRADVLVTETFDAGLFGEGILPTLCHAWSHLLKNSPGQKGQVIPGHAQLYLQAVECDAILQESRFLGQFVGINTSDIHICGFTGLCEMDPYAAQDLKHLPHGYRTLSEPLKFMDVDFNDPAELARLNKGQIQETDLEISCNGRLDAIAVWFSLHLDSCVEIRTHTDCKGCWEQAIFPVHPFKVQMQPLSRGSTCVPNVQAGDRLTVLNGLVGTKLCMEVSAIFNPLEASISCNPHVLQLLHNPDVWQTQSVFCLPSKEIKTLNNMSLHSAQHKQMQELFALMKKDNSQVDFIHLNDGFSPLCLQALKKGFRQASMWVDDNCQRALLQKLMILNEIDTQKLKVIEDTSDGTSVLISGQGLEDTETLAMSDTKAASGRAVVVMCDLVDAQGRIIESLRCREEVLRHHLSSYVRTAVSPSRVDVCGVLVHSEHLLSLSRVQSNDNTLSFNIGHFINKYSTRNHQDISLGTLPHTKLTEQFRMFTIDMYKLLRVPELDTAAEICTLAGEAVDGCPEVQQQNEVSACSSIRQRDRVSLACLQPGHSKELFELELVDSSCTPIPSVSVAAGFASLAESEDVAQEVCGADSCLRASGFKTNRNPDGCERQNLFHENDTVVSKQEPVDVGVLVSESVGHREYNTEYNTQQLISMAMPKTSCLNEKAASSGLSVPECKTMRNKKRSSSGQLIEQDRAVGGSSPERKRARPGRVDGSEECNAFINCDLNSEYGELTQSVHLKIPIIQSGQVTALVYWFDLHVSPACSVSTSDMAHHWNQAAVMSVPSQTQDVAAGDVLSLFCQMDGSAISFLIE